MWNDVGRQVDDSSDVAPRLTAVYDVKADGKLLVRASVGSYYQNLGLDFAFREFSELPTGQQAFTEFNWNAATQRYDRFRTTRPPPAAGGDIQFVDHARKDQITVGVDVQLSRNWVFKGGLVAHETDGIPFGNTQYLPDGSGDQRVLDKWPGAFRDYQGINLELNRRFRGGWMLRTNLKLGEGEGNTATANSATTLFNALGGVEVCDCPFEGSTDASTRFRTGSLFNDIDRLNILGMKRFQFGGKQALTLGGFLAITSGRYWGRTRSTSVAHPDTHWRDTGSGRKECATKHLFLGPHDPPLFGGGSLSSAARQYHGNRGNLQRRGY